MRHPAHPRKGIPFALMVLGVLLMAGGMLCVHLDAHIMQQTGRTAASLLSSRDVSGVVGTPSRTAATHAAAVYPLAAVDPDQILTLLGITSAWLLQFTLLLLRATAFKWLYIGSGSILLGLGMMLLSRQHVRAQTASEAKRTVQDKHQPIASASCPVCQSALRPSAHFCGVCGQPLKQSYSAPLR